MLAHVAHALERRADAQRADDDAQVARDRLLAGQDVDGQLVELERGDVDLAVVGDDGLGERDVRFVERARRVVDGDGDEVSDLDEALLHLAQFLLEDFAHRHCPFAAGTVEPAQFLRHSGPRKVNGRWPRPEHCSQRCGAFATGLSAGPNVVTNLVAMDPATLVPLALALGVLVGAGVTILIFFAARRGQDAAEVVNTAVPDGVDQVLDTLESAGVVIDPSNTVVKASPGALAFGLVWNRALVHPELIAMVDQVRRTGEPITKEVHLARGPIGEASIYLWVRVARLGARYVLLIAEDRTEGYRLEEVRRDFVANISHELKTPIGAVGLLAEALVSASDEPEQVKRFAKRLTKESERLAKITQEIIQLSRLQAADALTKPVAHRRRQRARARRRPEPGRGGLARHPPGQRRRRAPTSTATRRCSWWPCTTWSRTPSSTRPTTRASASA